MEAKPGKFSVTENNNKNTFYKTMLRAQREKGIKEL